MLAFLALLWVAGGASRPDAYGQVVVRAGSGACIIIVVLFGDWRRVDQARPVWILLAATFALVLLQCLPLPPEIWQALPGRSAFLAAAGDAVQPWRPWSIVPDATINAAISLIVPLAALLVIANLQTNERRWLPGLVVLLCAAAMMVGLLQLSGGGYDNPLINDTPGQISGSFANRNHFALFLAIGILVVPIWAFANEPQSRWRPPVAISLLIMFMLTIVASGSRAGMLLGGFAAVLGLTIAANGIKTSLRRYPPWVFPALIGGIGGIVAVLVLFAAAAGRALSINRLAENDVGQDMRARALPTVWHMLRDYFPAGSGFGSFDPLFRMHEPFELLKPTYFNHAHNDWLEVLLDAGIPGLLLVGVAIGWWGWASIAAWRGPSSAAASLARLGSAALLLIFIASIFDYPARTPAIMAIIILSGMWLSGRTQNDHALPR